MVLAKMFGEGEERSVFFANVVENADGAARAGRKTGDFASGAAKFTLERLDALHGNVEVVLEEIF
jgi:hypothetical protein